MAVRLARVAWRVHGHAPEDGGGEPEPGIEPVAAETGVGGIPMMVVVAEGFAAHDVT